MCEKLSLPLVREALAPSLLEGKLTGIASAVPVRATLITHIGECTTRRTIAATAVDIAT